MHRKVLSLRSGSQHRRASRCSMGVSRLTLGGWHFHLCVAEHKDAYSAERAQRRRVAKVALFEIHGARCGSSWGLRLWNGFDEQMITVFLPNPYLSDELRRLKQPDCLRLWHSFGKCFSVSLELNWRSVRMHPSFTPEEASHLERRMEATELIEDHNVRVGNAERLAQGLPGAS
jgi:hypothetical protein